MTMTLAPTRNAEVDDDLVFEFEIVSVWDDELMPQASTVTSPTRYCPITRPLSCRTAPGSDD